MYSLIDDIQIKKLCRGESPMIAPFIDEQIRGGCISYGLSSFGYDIRLSDKDFYTFKHLPGRIVDPKAFSPDFLEPQAPTFSDTDTFYTIPSNSYALGVTVERFIMPHDVMAICMTKSTYARSGILVNVTPLEPGWGNNGKGSYLTLEIANVSSSDVRVYANEGIAQLIFYRGDRPSVTYDQRQGKYNNQPQAVVQAKV